MFRTLRRDEHEFKKVERTQRTWLRRWGVIAQDSLLPFPVWQVLEVSACLGTRDLDRDVWCTMPIQIRTVDAVLATLSPGAQQRDLPYPSGMELERRRGLLSSILSVSAFGGFFLSCLCSVLDDRHARQYSQRLEVRALSGRPPFLNAARSKILNQIAPTLY